MMGNVGFFKLDFVLTQHNNLSLRLNTSRYYGHNNVFLDPASPLTSFGISDNGEEDVSTESAATTLTSNLSYRAVSRLQAQFSRDLQQSTANSTDPLTQNHQSSSRALDAPRFFPGRPASTACIWKRRSVWRGKEIPGSSAAMRC